MAPKEWTWSGDEVSSDNWSCTVAEREFRVRLRSAASSGKDGRDSSADSSSDDAAPPQPRRRASVQAGNVKVEEPDEGSLSIGSMGGRVPQARQAEPSDDVKPISADNSVDKPSLPVIPPKVLKAQLLAVLRSRLGEAGKPSNAPLRMKKYVVWNCELPRAFSIDCEHT